MNLQQMLSNPLIQGVLGSENPKQFAMTYITKSPTLARNPVVKNIISEMMQGKQVDVASIGRNVAHEVGVENPDVIVNQLSKLLSNE